MTHPLLTKLKITCKHILGSFVYNWVYLKNKSRKFLDFSLKGSFASHNRTNLITLTSKHWRIYWLIICLIIGLYYGLGAWVSSKIDNKLNQEIKLTTPTNHYSIASLNHVLKTQIDSNPWTPALPIIFPAAILDNLPNFQIGAKDTINYYIKNFASLYPNTHLNNAKELLSYPSDIWLFSQTKDDKLSPGSAKQYRKALAELELFISQDAYQYPTDTANLLYLLKATDSLLNKYISKISTYTQEHNSELLDFKADDLFYKTQGAAYATHYLLSGLAKDYQQQIVNAEQYENITTILKFLSDSIKFNPLVIKSATLNDSYSANHLIYLAYYLLQAQNHLKDIIYNISQKTLEPLP